MNIDLRTAAKPDHAADASTDRHAAAQDLVDVLFDVSSHSASLLASRHPARVGGCDFDIPKFILLEASNC